MTITPTLFWTVLIIFGVIIVGLLYFLMNLLQQVEKYEDIVEEQTNFLNSLGKTVRDTNAHLKELDTKGSFESDDETGYFFNELKRMIEELNRFQVPDNYGQKEE